MIVVQKKNISFSQKWLHSK